MLGSTPFCQLDLPVQAMMQVAVKRFICTGSASHRQMLHEQLELVGRVPLLHTEDFETLMRKAEADGRKTSKVLGLRQC